MLICLLGLAPFHAVGWRSMANTLFLLLGFASWRLEGLVIPCLSRFGVLMPGAATNLLGFCFPMRAFC